MLPTTTYMAIGTESGHDVKQNPRQEQGHTKPLSLPTGSLAREEESGVTLPPMVESPAADAQQHIVERLDVSSEPSTIGATWQLHDFYDRVERDTVASLPRPRSPQDWAALKPKLRKAVADAIGYRPDLLSTVDAERRGKTQRKGYTVERIVFHGWPDAPISANLYVPDDAPSPAPAILAPHGHSMDGKAYDVYQHCHINLARRGCIVLAWDMIGYGEREAMGHREGYWFLLPGLSLKGAMVTEGQALLTWLLAQDGVDAARIGCTGNSGGGAQTLLLAALDTRIAAAAPAGHVSPWSFIAGKEKDLCACTMLPHAIALVEIEHMLGLIAPRHCLIVAGRNDNLFPDDLVRRAHRLGRRMYALEGVTGRLELSVTSCAHGYEQPKREAMYAFFDRVLKGEDPGEVTEPPTVPEPADSPVLRCWPDSRPTFVTVHDLARHLAHGKERRQDRAEHLARNVLGIRAVPDVVQFEKRGGTEGWDEGVLATSHGIELPCVAVLPGHADRAMVVIDDTGKGSDRARRSARAGREAGEAVVAVDLLGWGQTKPEELLERGDDETFAAQRGLFFGRPLVGERVAELLAVTSWLASTHALGEMAVSWHAFGWAGLVALLASAVERPEVSLVLHEVRLHDLPMRSFWDETDPPRPLSSFPYDILSVGDLDDLTSDRVFFA